MYTPHSTIEKWIGLGSRFDFYVCFLIYKYDCQPKGRQIWWEFGVWFIPPPFFCHFFESFVLRGFSPDFSTWGMKRHLLVILYPNMTRLSVFHAFQALFQAFLCFKRCKLDFKAKYTEKSDFWGTKMIIYSKDIYFRRWERIWYFFQFSINIRRYRRNLALF